MSDKPLQAISFVPCVTSTSVGTSPGGRECFEDKSLAASKWEGSEKGNAMDTDMDTAEYKPADAQIALWRF